MYQSKFIKIHLHIQNPDIGFIFCKMVMARLIFVLSFKCPPCFCHSEMAMMQLEKLLKTTKKHPSPSLRFPVGVQQKCLRENCNNKKTFLEKSLTCVRVTSDNNWLLMLIWGWCQLFPRLSTEAGPSPTWSGGGILPILATTSLSGTRKRYLANFENMDWRLWRVCCVHSPLS